MLSMVKQSLKDEIQKLKDVRLSLQKSDSDLAEVFDRRIKEYEKNYQNLGEHDIYNTRKHPLGRGRSHESCV